MSRSLDDLTPQVKKLAESLIVNCKQKYDIEVRITSTYRSLEEQDALFAQGRQSIIAVNKLRKIAGLGTISEKENKVVTNAKRGQSKHNFRIAFDVCPMIDGKPCWDTNNPAWKKIGDEGISLGLEWAGNWVKFKEYPHFQYTKTDIPQIIEIKVEKEEHPINTTCPEYKYL